MTEKTSIDTIKEQMRSLDKHVPQTRSQTIIIDECIPSENTASLINQLVGEGYKVVFARGGSMSNEDQIKAIKANDSMKDTAIVQMGIKPLNGTQMQEFFEMALEANDFLGMQEQLDIRQAWSVVEKLSVDAIPISYHVAKNLLTELIGEEGVLTKIRSGAKLTATASIDDWAQELTNRIREGAYGNIHKLPISS